MLVMGECTRQEADNAIVAYLVRIGVAEQALGRGTPATRNKSTVYINGYIGGGLAEVQRDLKQARGLRELQIDISSGGGRVDHAHAFYGTLMGLKDKGVKIKTRGEGYVMSAAMQIYMAGDERTATPGTQFMIHEPWALIMSPMNYTEAPKIATEVQQFLKPHREDSLGIYRSRGIRNPEQYFDGDDHFLTRDQAYEAGITTVRYGNSHGGDEGTGDPATPEQLAQINAIQQMYGE